MKLQHKLALYNTFTKVAIVAVMGLLIVIFIDRISMNHLKQRLIDKRDKLVDALSEEEIDDLLKKENSFTDYNILKEEYIVLREVRSNAGKSTRFVTEKREIDGEQQEYLIIEDPFNFEGRSFMLEIGETTEAVTLLRDTIYYSTLLVLIISLVFTFFADLAFTRVLLSPFYKIIDLKINKVNDPVHYNHEPVSTTTDDFRQLDSSIGSLMSKISDIFLAEKQFISNISHELLTPISVLRSRLENMLNDENLTEESQARLVASLKTLIRLKSVVNSLLLISKVENNQFARNENVDIQAVVSEVSGELEDRMRARNITLDIHMAEHPAVQGNHALIHTLIINLVNNAVKYNLENGRITISDERVDDVYRLVIADTGIGMDESQINQAFNRFAKLSDEDNDSHGLGLAIVKSIAAFHNIRVMLDSKKGYGTTVTLEISAA